MKHAILRMATGLGLAAGVAGCATAEPAPEPTRPQSWRQVYVFPGTSESGRELLVWDFTDPHRPVVRVFSFQDDTFRNWKEVLLPTEPGTMWAREQDGALAPAK